MIIAIKEKDRVVLGYSNVEYWNGVLAESDYVDEENIAIRFSENGYVFACADMGRAADVLLYDDGFINDPDMDPKSIVRFRASYIKETLDVNGVSYEKDNWKNALLMCNDEHIYGIDPGFGFYEAEDYACHGFHTDLMRSVLDNTKGLSARERIIQAASFSEEVSKEGVFPLVITDTKTKQFEIIYKGEKE